MPGMFRCLFACQRPSRGSGGYSAEDITELSIAEAVASLGDVNALISFFQLWLQVLKQAVLLLSQQPTMRSFRINLGAMPSVTLARTLNS